MYAVVGCSACEALWVVEGRPETTGCPRCGTRHWFDRLTRFAETADRDAARQARATLLAERSGEAEALAELGSFAELDDRLDGGRGAEAEDLAAAGLDPDAVEAAGEAAERGLGGRRRPRLDVVLGALRELDAPTAGEVASFAEERGVPGETARSLLERLVGAGDVTETGGRYRLL